MKDSHQIIRRPLITEKSTHFMEKQGYVFQVAPDANRIEIKHAIEDLFDVKVKKVNVLWQRGKMKRVGRNIGMTKRFKKAVVTLQPGHKIDVF